MKEIETYHINSCPAFAFSDFLLVSRYEFTPQSVSESSFVFDSKSNTFTPIPLGFPRNGVYAREGGWVVLGSASNASNLNATSLLCKTGTRLPLSGSELLFVREDYLWLVKGRHYQKYDVSLRLIGEGEWDGDDGTPKYADEACIRKGGRALMSPSNPYLLYYLYEDEARISVRYFKADSTTKAELVYDPSPLLKDVAYDGHFFFLLQEKGNTIVLSKYDKKGSLVEKETLKGRDGFFAYLGERLLLVYDDHARWTPEQRKAYPEFEAGPSSIRELH